MKNWALHQRNNRGNSRFATDTASLWEHWSCNLSDISPHLAVDSQDQAIPNIFNPLFAFIFFN